MAELTTELDDCAVKDGVGKPVSDTFAMIGTWGVGFGFTCPFDSSEDLGILGSASRLGVYDSRGVGRQLS